MRFSFSVNFASLHVHSTPFKVISFSLSGWIEFSLSSWQFDLTTRKCQHIVARKTKFVTENYMLSCHQSNYPFHLLNLTRWQKEKEHINDTKMLSTKENKKNPFILAFKYHLGNAAKKFCMHCCVYNMRNHTQEFQTLYSFKSTCFPVIRRAT